MPVNTRACVPHKDQTQTSSMMCKGSLSPAMLLFELTTVQSLTPPSNYPGLTSAAEPRMPRELDQTWARVKFGGGGGTFFFKKSSAWRVKAPT